MIKKQGLKSAAVLMIVALLVGFSRASGAGSAARDFRTLRVGSELDFYPYAFTDENGLLTGFSIDLIQAVAHAMGLSITISTGSWHTVWNDLVAGKLDLLPIVAKLPNRAQLVDFSLPHTETFDAFFVRRGAVPIRDIKGARGKEIVVMRSDAAHHALLERNFTEGLVLVDTIPEGLSLVASGKHDAMLCSKLIGILAIKKYGIMGLSAGPPIQDYTRVFSFAVKKGNTELLEKLNQGLLIVKTNGEYERIYEKWLTADDPWRRFEKYFWPALTVLITVVLAGSFWVVMLQLLVKKRTHQLAERNEMLRLAHEELEERVKQRTAELAQVNAVLQTDIAKRKQIEEELMRHNALYRRAEVDIRELNEELAARIDELQGVNRELEAFTSSVSHDLRAPLRSISGFVNALEEDCADRLDNPGRDYLARINNSAKRMGRLIDDLLHLSRISRQGMERRGVDMSGIAATIIGELRGNPVGRNIEAHVEDGLAAFADPRLIEIALSNIIRNAWKFTSKIRNGRVEFGKRELNGKVVYFVRDNGAGFDQNYSEKMFQPFQRLHSDQEFEGTGIGLAIVERIISRHGGQIWAEGEIGKGATVYFTLG